MLWLPEFHPLPPLRVVLGDGGQGQGVEKSLTSLGTDAASLLSSAEPYPRCPCWHLWLQPVTRDIRVPRWLPFTWAPSAKTTASAASASSPPASAGRLQPCRTCSRGTQALAHQPPGHPDSTGLHFQKRKPITPQCYLTCPTHLRSDGKAPPRQKN